MGDDRDREVVSPRRPFFALALILAALGLIPDVTALGPRITYKGLATDQWEAEIRHWDPVIQAYHNKAGRWSIWERKPPFWEEWLRLVGLQILRDRKEMHLLTGDSAAIPVLTELLKSRNPKTRLLALEGLEKVSERARVAFPSIIPLLEDENWGVRLQAGQALYRIDREKAEQVGLEWTIGGLNRKGQ